MGLVIAQRCDNAPRGGLVIAQVPLFLQLPFLPSFGKKYSTLVHDHDLTSATGEATPASGGEPHRTARSARRHAGPSGRLLRRGTPHISGVPLSQSAVRGSFEGHVPGVEHHVGLAAAAARAPPLLPMAAWRLTSRKTHTLATTEVTVGRRYVPHSWLAVCRPQGGNCHRHADHSRPTCVECPPH